MIGRRLRRLGDERAPDIAEHSAEGSAHGDFAGRAGTGGALAVAAAEVADLLIRQHLAFGRRGFTICSASAGAGASFVAAKLAHALARAGVSTLLVDADLDHPGQKDQFPSRDIPPNLRLLLASSAVESIDIPEVAPRLSVLHAGEPNDSVAKDMIASARFERLIQAMLRDYDCTIVDVPPANTSPTALHVSALLGYALIVARRHVSFFDDITLLVDQLEQQRVTVIGAVLIDSE